MKASGMANVSRDLEWEEASKRSALLKRTKI